MARRTTQRFLCRHERSYGQFSMRSQGLDSQKGGIMFPRSTFTIFALCSVLIAACAPAPQAPSEATTVQNDESQVSERGFPPSLRKKPPRPPPIVQPPPSAPQGSTIPLYRLYNPKSGDHFYTTSATE